MHLFVCITHGIQDFLLFSMHYFIKMIWLSICSYHFMCKFLNVFLFTMKCIFIFQFLFLILCWNWYKFDMFQKLQGQQLNYCQVNMTLGSWPNSQNREIDASQRDPTFLTQIAFLAFQLMKSWISRTFCWHSFVLGKLRTIMNLNYSLKADTTSKKWNVG